MQMIHEVASELLNAPYEVLTWNNAFTIFFCGLLGTPAAFHLILSSGYQYPVSKVKYDIESGQCTPEVDGTAPIYVVIGDGGNIE
ncbi:hypothetical protein R1flu_008626 [Riccia fluitans]|uniref:Uncharacterized protein n=1 Tax=Riccia fluitans TaxID=41844 RepID=A0ABD1YC67_9MARC